LPYSAKFTEHFMLEAEAKLWFETSLYLYSVVSSSQV